MDVYQDSEAACLWHCLRLTGPVSSVIHGQLDSRCRISDPLYGLAVKTIKKTPVVRCFFDTFGMQISDPLHRRQVFIKLIEGSGKTLFNHLLRGSEGCEFILSWINWGSAHVERRLAFFLGECVGIQNFQRPRGAEWSTDCIALFIGERIGEDKLLWLCDFAIIKSNAAIFIVKPFGPHQCFRCSASVNILNTSSRGALKVRIKPP